MFRKLRHAFSPGARFGVVQTQSGLNSLNAAASDGAPTARRVQTPSVRSLMGARVGRPRGDVVAIPSSAIPPDVFKNEEAERQRDRENDSQWQQEKRERQLVRDIKCSHGCHYLTTLSGFLQRRKRAAFIVAVGGVLPRLINAVSTLASYLRLALVTLPICVIYRPWGER